MAGKADAQAKMVTTMAATATGSAFCEIVGLVIAMVIEFVLVQVVCLQQTPLRAD
jgi:hypothetical protein